MDVVGWLASLASPAGRGCQGGGRSGDSGRVTMPGQIIAQICPAITAKSSYGRKIADNYTYDDVRES